MPYFVNSTLQNENFLQKMRILIEKLHFLAKLFGHSEKKSYLCMLFRGDVSLARVYTGARSLSGETAEAVLKTGETGRQSRREAWKHLITIH